MDLGLDAAAIVASSLSQPVEGGGLRVIYLVERVCCQLADEDTPWVPMDPLVFMLAPCSMTNAKYNLYDNGGLFNVSGSGIVGLGRGPNSLASQVGLSSAARFSYCLITFTYQGNATSKLSFGNTELEFGSGVVYTPLLYGGVSDNDYYVTLIAISVGKKRIELTNPSESGDSEEGNMVIDSGTTVTILPEELFPGFVSAVKDEIHLPIVDDPTFQQLSLCYNSSLDDFRPPSITVHFTGADVELSSKIKFISVDEQVVCLAFSPSVEVEPIALFGNLAQSNLAVTFDILNQQVLFKPMDSTKL
ncbi:aspartic proteinase CDR1 [Quercus suber]|uniref:aspartic proteinase CDR1 n=1 Tax=Quercus suber TaxID=58331 RepID=UPI000CE1B89B|nr:aspartic proteinase CDR1-like [Quercus suber]